MSNVVSAVPDPLLTPSRVWAKHREFDLVIVGAGIAGLAMTLRLPEDLRIAVVTKGTLGESNTRYAQGGFAAPIAPDDDIDLHIEDTLVAGAGLSDPATVRTLISGAAKAVAWLIEQGTHFDEDEGGLALGREAAHSRNRILHAGGDATGAEIERALVARLRARTRTTILDRTAAIDLLIDHEPRCRGVIVCREGAAASELLSASSVVLANGGAGQLWAVTSNPKGATGDGMAMALRAGVALADLEFAQFHPTVLALPDAEGFLISEAVRGEGAHLRAKDGERFMLAINPLAELAPRDVVARGIQRQMALDDAGFVNLDLRHLDPAMVSRRFPTICAHLQKLGLDLATDLIPVAPAAHYFMGGIVADAEGATSMAGLRAIGEVSCTGVHGANRLASNSLLEGLVFGLRAADAIASHSIEHAVSPLPAAARQLQNLNLDIDPADGPTIAELRAMVQHIMSQDVAVVRSETLLAEAAADMQAIADMVSQRRPDTFAADELRNMVALGREVIASATFREESRGGHYRSDHPEHDHALDGEHQIVTSDGETRRRVYARLETVIVREESHIASLR